MAGFTWPGEHRAALALTFDVDAESAILAVDPELRPPPDDDEPPGLRAQGGRAPDPAHAGARRRHRQLLRPRPDRRPLSRARSRRSSPPATTSATTATRTCPITASQTTASARDVERALESLERITGRRPEGFRAPWWELTDSTPALLAEYGFTLGLEHDGRRPPVPARHGPGILAELPVHWMLDDWEQYAFLPEPHIGARHRVAGEGARPVDERARRSRRRGRPDGADEPSVPVGPGVACRDARARRRARPRGRRHLDRAARRDRRAHAGGHRPRPTPGRVPSVHIEEGIYER